MTILPIGKFAAHVDEIKDVVGKRTGFEIDIINFELLTRYEEADTDGRAKTLNLLCFQALQDAEERGI